MLILEKNYYKAKILEDLAKKDDFDLYRIFLTDIPTSFKYWEKLYVENHCKVRRTIDAN